jgi:hypothetical protein
MIDPNLTPEEFAAETREVHAAVEIMRARREEARSIREAAERAMAEAREAARLRECRGKAEARTRSIRAAALAALNGTPYLPALLVALVVALVALAPRAQAAPIPHADPAPERVIRLAPGAEVHTGRVEALGVRIGRKLVPVEWVRYLGGRTWVAGPVVFERVNGDVINQGRRVAWARVRPSHWGESHMGRVTLPDTAVGTDSGRSAWGALALVLGFVTFMVGGSLLAACLADRRGR